MRRESALSLFVAADKPTFCMDNPETSLVAQANFGCCRYFFNVSIIPISFGVPIYAHVDEVLPLTETVRLKCASHRFSIAKPYVLLPLGH